MAIIQTLDFFTPIVDSPYHFGRIAAANSLSDVYAMGGSPKTAMNIVAYPLEKMGPEPLKEMLAGGADTLREADTVLLGGHSVEDQELKYGLSVTGFVHPARILKNQGLRDGDCLILTKPLGTGIINTAIKGGLASDITVSTVTEIMAALNRRAAETIERFDVSACTDVTGFGLLGHLAEMIDGGGMGVTLDTDQVPVIPGTYDFAAMGLVPVGAHKNRTHRQNMVIAPDNFDPVLRDILFDPQTSGGLLFSCREKDAATVVESLRDDGVAEATVIGVVTGDVSEVINLK